MNDYKKDISEFIGKIGEKYGILPKFAHNMNEKGNKIFYSGPYFNNNELEACIESLLFSPWSVNGEKVAEFEDKFCEIIGEKYAASCNSGSSANLILITAAKEYFNWSDEDEILVSPVGFPSTVSPITQNNLKATFIDIEWETLNFDLIKIEEKINSKTKAIFVSPVLGNPPDIDLLISICEKYKLILLCDCCDSLGSKWRGKDIQKYFFASSHSFYPAHHISILNGGMVTSDNYEFIKICKSLTTWSRDCFCKGRANLLPLGTCKKRFSKWLENYDGIVDHKYVFPRMGYNLQILDMQAAIGLEQLKKFPYMETKRRFHFNYIKDLLNKYIKDIYIPQNIPNADPSWFGVPIVCQNKGQKNKLVNYFETNNLQTRSYFAGNLLLHKGFEKLDDYRKYPNANDTLNRVFFIGCWPGYGQKQLDIIENILKNYGK